MRMIEIFCVRDYFYWYPEIYLVLFLCCFSLSLSLPVISDILFLSFLWSLLFLLHFNRRSRLLGASTSAILASHKQVIIVVNFQFDLIMSLASALSLCSLGNVASYYFNDPVFAAAQSGFTGTPGMFSNTSFGQAYVTFFFFDTLVTKTRIYGCILIDDWSLFFD